MTLSIEKTEVVDVLDPYTTEAVPGMYLGSDTKAQIIL